ncbi:uncharacterized protein [Pithys albifrons albifrons]|uniref:uncharacterized protein isoform X2 n=1 Tax=Pithys albifrons albifrons TaxID=3385563 RepID=UPI003A5CF340
MRAAARGRDRALLPPELRPGPCPAARLPPCPSVRAGGPRGSGARRAVRRLPEGAALVPGGAGCAPRGVGPSVRLSVHPSIHPSSPAWVAARVCVCVTDDEAHTARGSRPHAARRGHAGAPRLRQPLLRPPEPSPMGATSAASLLVLLLPPGGASGSDSGENALSRVCKAARSLQSLGRFWHGTHKEQFCLLVTEFESKGCMFVILCSGLVQ